MSEIRLRYKGVNEFVRDLTSRVNDPTGDFTFVKLLRLTVSNLSELNLFVVPSLMTIKGAVEDTLTVPLPEDTIQPVAAFIYQTCAGNEFLFRLGKRERVYSPSYEFASCPDALDTEACTAINTFNFYGEPFREFYLYTNFYGERYGKRNTRFYGWFSYDVVNQRLEVLGPTTGQILLVVCETANEDCKLIPTDVAPMLGYKVLQQYYESTNVGQAMYMERQFKIALNEFKRRRSDNYSYNDYLDAVTSEYSSNVR